MAWATAAILLAGALPLGGCRCGSPTVGDRPDGPAVVVVDPDDLHGVDADPEREPNDERKTAQPLAAGRGIAGTLKPGKPGDRDWYAVTVAEPAILKASVTGVPQTDLVIEAYRGDEPGRLMRVNNEAEGGGETLVNLAVDPGRYYLVVHERRGRATSGDARYRIGFVLRERDEGEELEPNWKLETASVLPLGGEVIGYHGWRSDDDWYRVSLEGRVAGSLLRVEFDGVDEVPAELSVLDAAGTKLVERHCHPGAATVLANIRVPEAAQAVYVRVSCGAKASVDGRYALRVASVVPTGLTEAEPNDTPAGATSIPPGKSVRGALGDRRDTDLYSPALAGPLRVVVRPPRTVDVELALVDADGKALWQVNEGGPGGEEVLPVVQLPPGGGYLRVRADRASAIDGQASYTIAARSAGAGPWEQEPNGQRDKATRWQPGAPISGFLHPAGDADHFVLTTAPPAGELSVTLPPRVGATVELLDAEGVLLRKVSGEGTLTITGAGPAGEGARLTVRIMANPKQGSAEAPYTVRWSAPPSRAVAAPAGS